jgi:outer membrane lipoprotein carrier protein
VYEGDVVLEGIPRSVSDQVTNTVLEVNPQGVIRRIVIDQMDGSTTEFRFLSQKENVQVPDERFRFTPPAGVEVLQGNELTQP